MALTLPNRRARRATLRLMLAVLFASGTAIAPLMAAETLSGPIAASVLEVVDGDTLRVRVRVWIGQTVDVLVRIRGIDAPEVRARCEVERLLAAEATLALDRAVADREVVLAAVEGDKYFGRVVADVSTAAGLDVAAYMHDNGFARAYDGGTRLGWCGELAAG